MINRREYDPGASPRPQMDSTPRPEALVRHIDLATSEKQELAEIMTRAAEALESSNKTPDLYIAKCTIPILNPINLEFDYPGLSESRSYSRVPAGTLSVSYEARLDADGAKNKLSLVSRDRDSRPIYTFDPILSGDGDYVWTMSSVSSGESLATVNVSDIANILNRISRGFNVKWEDDPDFGEPYYSNKLLHDLSFATSTPSSRDIESRYFIREPYLPDDNLSIIYGALLVSDTPKVSERALVLSAPLLNLGNRYVGSDYVFSSSTRINEVVNPGREEIEELVTTSQHIKEHLRGDYLDGDAQLLAQGDGASRLDIAKKYIDIVVRTPAMTA